MIIRLPPSPGEIYWRTVPLIVVGWLFVVIAIAATLNSNEPAVLIGAVIGTVFQQTILASVWAAVGPGKLLWRLPLSLGWACLMGSAMAVPLLFSPNTDPTFMYILTMAGFWLVGTLPIWLVAKIFGLRLRHQATVNITDEAKEHQFGIGQLMIFTAFVAILLGIGRLIVASGWLPGIDWELVLILGVLLAAQILVGISVLFSSLLKRNAAAATIAALVFNLAISFVEIPIVLQIISGPSWELAWIMGSIKVVSAAWALTFAIVIRFSGYQFGLPDPERGIEYLEPLQQRTATKPEHVHYIDDA